MNPDTRNDLGILALVPHRLQRICDLHDVTASRGVILFADVAGFTRLTDNAARREGTRGIEVLSGHINSILGDLVDSVLDSGGDVLKFGGDAILAAFDSDGDDALAVRRATRCATLMRHAMMAHRGTFLRSLTLHLGLAHGHWNECVAGIVGTRREHFVWGRAVDDAMTAAELSTGRACFVCDEEFLPVAVRKRSRRIGRRMFQIPPDSADGADVADATQHARGMSGMWDFIPPGLRSTESIASFDPYRSAEHRRVATLFVFWSAPGCLRIPHRSRELLEEIVCFTHTVSSELNGTWVRSDPSGGRQKLLILFGALSSKQEDGDYALQCATLLRTKFSAARSRFPSIKASIGIATGTVFTGFVGNLRRREFTVMGDRVNLAARLAARAVSGSTLTDSETRDDAVTYLMKHAGELRLKNIRTPTAVYRPVRRIQPPTATGQDAAITEHPGAMQTALSVWTSGARLIRLSVMANADAELFLNQFAARSGIEPVEIVTVELVRDDSSHPGRTLKKVAARLQEFAEPGTVIVPNGFTNQGPLSSDASIARLIARRGLESAVREVVQSLVLPRTLPELAVLLHAEHLTEFDKSVIRELAERGATRWIVVSYSEPHLTQETNPESSITLGAVTRSELATICAEILYPARVSSALVDFLHTRSQGNVKLARKYLGYITSRGYATQTSGKHAVWHLRNPDSIDIPNGLRAHYLHRVDQLGQTDRTVLRAVAVLGDLASVEFIQRLCEDINDRRLQDSIARLTNAGLLYSRDTDGVTSLAFVDTTCRRAVYDTMTHASRESWHRIAAELIRKQDVSQIELIGEHLFLSRDPRSVKWLTKAARNARSVWSLDRARLLYRWAALACQGKFVSDDARTCPSASANPSRDLLAIQRSLAEVFELQGLHQEAARLHRRLSHAYESTHDRNRAYQHRLMAARMDWFAGHYHKSGRQARAILKAVRPLPDKSVLAQAAFLLGETARRTGRVRESLRALSKAEVLARSCSDTTLRSDILNALGLLHWNCGRLLHAQSCFKSALDLLRKRNDLSRRGQVANNLGILLEEQGRLPQAQRYYERAFAIFDRAGVRRRRAYSLGNLANLDRHAARYERARCKYEEVDTELRAIGELHAAAYTVGNLGDLVRDFGDYMTARDRYDETLAFALKSGDEELKSECYSRQALLHLLTGRSDLVTRLVRKAERAAQASDSREFALFAMMVKLEHEILKSGFGAVRQLIERAVRDAESSGLVIYRLWSLHARVRQLDADGKPAEARTLIRRGIQMSEQCGYVWWGLRLSGLGMKECHPLHFQESCLRRAERLLEHIQSGIGDETVRSRFEQMPLIQELRSRTELKVDRTDTSTT